MGRKRRYGRVYSEQDLERLQMEALQVAMQIGGDLEKRQQGLLRLIEEKGAEKATLLLAGLLTWRGRGEYAPNPRSYTDLQERLDRVRANGWPVDGLRASRVGLPWEEELCFTLPLSADLKEYSRAMQAWQEYFQSLERSKTLIPAYLADEHGQGRTYSELADELNGAVLQWAEGKLTGVLEAYNLDGFLKSKGYTPERARADYEAGVVFFDAERVTSIVKYYWKHE